MASFSKDDICNMALGLIGVTTRVQDVDNEKSNEAKQCRLFYDNCLSTMLEMRPWDFATERVELQLIDTDGLYSDEWGFRYAYPNDCHHAIKIVNPSLRTAGPDQKIPYRIVRRGVTGDEVGKAILTDQENAVLEYNVFIEDPSEFSSSFVAALSLFLATRIAPALRVNAEIIKDVNKQFFMWLFEAGGKELREGREDPMPDSELVTSRA